jgi:hypothetical protein
VFQLNALVVSISSLPASFDQRRKRDELYLSDYVPAMDLDGTFIPLPGQCLVVMNTRL